MVIENKKKRSLLRLLFNKTLQNFISKPLQVPGPSASFPSFCSLCVKKLPREKNST